MSDELFKSYDPALPTDDLPALTRWLGSIFSEPIDEGGVAARDLAGWRAALRRRGVYVTFSSGTGGSPSIVPRDESTLLGLRMAAGVRMAWAPEDGRYNCLLLVPPGMGLGIQSGAAGLAAGAVRVHHLSAEEVEVGSRAAPGDHDSAVDFLKRSAKEGMPVVVYGTPAAAAELVGHLGSPTVRSAPGSCVVTGGGWKGGDPAGAVSRRRLAEAFGVPFERCVDTYSTAELNTVLVTCAASRYHVPPSVEAVILDDLFEPLPDGTAGRLAVLDPFAFSYPGFIATGDIGRLHPEPCPCGLSGQTLAGPIVRAAGAPVRGCGVALSVDT